MICLKDLRDSKTSNRGGARINCGRKKKAPTKVVRIPDELEWYMKSIVNKFNVNKFEFFNDNREAIPRDKIRHFHGTPIWGAAGEVLKVAIRNGGAFVSYVRHDQIKQCMELAQEIAIDNGAFSAWKRGVKLDWVDFYNWLENYYDHPKLKFFIIPDVIEGSESDNDKLINEVPEKFLPKAVPVFHLHEGLDRLKRLCEKFPRVAIGSSGEFAKTRTKAWYTRMDEVMAIARATNTRTHGLRMLDPRILARYKIDTADSTYIACNVPKYLKRAGCIKAHLKDELNLENKRELLISRAAIFRAHIERKI